MNVIPIASDHAGFAYKQQIIHALSDAWEFLDIGPTDDGRVDYPDYAHPLAEKISNNEYSMGVLICGSGNGVAITANKHAHVRCALCWSQELTVLARQHNDANVLALPARFISVQQAIDYTRTFLLTKFEGGRHLTRVNKIPC